MSVPYLNISLKDYAQLLMQANGRITRRGVSSLHKEDEPIIKPATPALDKTPKKPHHKRIKKESLASPIEEPQPVASPLIDRIIIEEKAFQFICDKLVGRIAIICYQNAYKMIEVISYDHTTKLYEIAEMNQSLELTENTVSIVVSNINAYLIHSVVRSDKDDNLIAALLPIGLNAANDENIFGIQLINLAKNTISSSDIFPIDRTKLYNYSTTAKENPAIIKLINKITEKQEQWFLKYRKRDINSINVTNMCLRTVKVIDNANHTIINGIALRYIPEDFLLCIRVTSKIVFQNEIKPTQNEIYWYEFQLSTAKLYYDASFGWANFLEITNYDLSSPPMYTFLDHSNISEKQQRMISEEESSKCQICHYALHNLESIMCYECSGNYHMQCIPDFKRKVPYGEQKWICPSCICCYGCYSKKSKETMLCCTQCYICYHKDCLIPDALSELPICNIKDIQWKCSKCSICKHCNSKTAGKKKGCKWSQDYTTCSVCQAKKQKRQYCPICEKIWENKPLDAMIECKCGMWVHKLCDTSVSVANFDAANYYCPVCKRNKKINEAMELIRMLEEEDKFEFFREPVDENKVAGYTNIIKKPMCFTKMKERCTNGEYIDNYDKLKSDFRLICANAMTFNMPKSRVYKEAEKLQQVGDAMLDRDSKEILEEKQAESNKMSMDETAKQYYLSPEEFDYSSIGLRKRKHIDYNEEKKLEKKEKTTEKIVAKEISKIERKKKKEERKVHIIQLANPLETTDKKPVGLLHEYEQIAYDEEKNNKCLYSNPVKCTFTDPNLCFSEICFLCGSFGNPSDFLTCNICGESFHPYCLNLPSMLNKSLEELQKTWKCINCKFCEKCYSALNEDRLLYCDNCDKAYHTYCLDPPLKSIPNCGWKCKDCFKCQICETTNFVNGMNPSNINDYTCSSNFSYCYKCGYHQYINMFCCICRKSDKLQSKYNPLEVCIKCKSKSHIKCSLYSYKNYQQMKKECIDFKCIMCIMQDHSSQEIHYETTESYMNIHDIIHKHSILASICKLALAKELEQLKSNHLASEIITSFIQENEDFFKHNSIIKKYLSLIQSNVPMENCAPCTPSSEENSILFPFKKQKESFSSVMLKKSSDAQSILAKAITMDDNMFSLFKKFDESIMFTYMPIEDRLSLILRKMFNMHTSNEEPVLNKESILEMYSKAVNAMQPSIIPSAITTAALYALRGSKTTNDTTEEVAKSNTEKEIILNPNQITTNQQFKQIDEDTFLPSRRTAFDSFVRKKSCTRLQKSTKIDELTEQIFKDKDKDVDFVENYIIRELPSILKIKELFAKWLPEYLKAKINDTKKPEKKHKKPYDDIANLNSVMLVPDEEDPMIETPSKNIPCCLCKLKGERKFSGRLIPFWKDMFVHVNCVIFTNETLENSEGAVYNFFIAYKRAKSIKCALCQCTGASIYCTSKKCHLNYHFSCALKSQMCFTIDKKNLCKSCSVSLAYTSGMPAELMGKRRIYIVKNKAPISKISETSLINIERWKPFYYECFNRIGNLTVLKLNDKLETMLKKVDVNNIVSNDGYCAIRIFWDIFRDNNTIPNLGGVNKAYYIFNSVKSEINVTILAKPALWVINDKISSFNKFRKTEEVPMNCETDKAGVKILSIYDVWSTWLYNIKQQIPKFSLENLSFSIKELCGLSKHPIKYWINVDEESFDIAISAIYQKRSQNYKRGMGMVKREFHTEADESTFSEIYKINAEANWNSSMTMVYNRFPTQKFSYSNIKCGNDDAKLKKIKQKCMEYESKNIKTNVKDADLPIAMKYRSYKSMAKKVEVAPSRIHKNGLFATGNFVPGEIVIEYVGELIRDKVADKREKEYEQKGLGDCYMFRIDKDMIIDATKFGSKARYLNHSCQPNCSAKINNIHGNKHILIYANRVIMAGEELTYDYQFDIEEQKIQCRCGAPNCQGRLN